MSRVAFGGQLLLDISVRGIPSSAACGFKVFAFVDDFSQDGFEEAQVQLEEAMKAQCYERIKLVKGVRKRVLVRIYFDDKRNVFTQVSGALALLALSNSSLA